MNTLALIREFMHTLYVPVLVGIPENPLLLVFYLPQPNFSFLRPVLSAVYCLSVTHSVTQTFSNGRIINIRMIVSQTL